MVEEIILAHRAHVCADALARLAVEFLQRDPFPFGRSLYHLRVDGMQVAVVRNVESDGCAGAVAIEQVVDAAIDIDDQWNLDHHEVERFAQIVFNVAFDLENGLLGLTPVEQGTIVIGQYTFKFGVIPNARSRQIGLLVVSKSRHESLRK